jgi:hypothetical protein
MKSKSVFLALVLLALGGLCGYLLRSPRAGSSFIRLTEREPCPHCLKSPRGVKAMDGIEAILTGTCPHCGKIVERPCPHCGMPVPVE